MGNQVKGKVLITGGTGSWGHELISQLLEFTDVTEIVVFSRNEHRQVQMKQYFGSNKITFLIGDIRELGSISRAMDGVNIVFHLAALKHVDVCESNSWEAVHTNIIGTQNLILASIEKKVSFVIDVSTDKAVEAHNIYGMTKACGEKLVLNAQKNYSVKTKFFCVRGGNVLGTNGSVVPLFKKQIDEMNSITVTNPDMTRFLMKKKQAISLLFKAFEKAKGGETFVIRMPAIKVSELAKAMIKRFGNSKTKIDIIGARPGEKLHETLISRNEMPFVEELSDNLFVIRQTSSLKNSHYKSLNIGANFASDNAKHLSSDDFLKLIDGEKI